MATAIDVSSIDAAAARVRARNFSFVLAGCALVFFSVIYLQRIGYALDEKSQIPISIIAAALALFCFFLSGMAGISVTRLMWMCLGFTGVIAALFIALPLDFSPFSFFYLVILYVPYVVTCEIEEDEYKAVLRLYQNLIIPPAVIAIIQFAMTMVHMQWWDPLYLLPAKFQMGGYNTHPPIAWDSPIIRANAEFFLEPSFVSQFMALGILIEMTYFRRYWRMVLCAGAILASLSGSGIMMLALFATYLMISRRQWTLIAGAVVALAVVFAFKDNPILAGLIGRGTEFTDENSSSFIRFIGPIVGIPDALGTSLQTWLGGLGPGQAKTLIFDGYVINPFPVAKLMIETGLVGTIPFTIFVTYCFFHRPFVPSLAAALYLMYAVLSGGLQQPHTVYLFLFLSIAFVSPRRPRPEQRRRGGLTANPPRLDLSHA